MIKELDTHASKPSSKICLCSCWCNYQLLQLQPCFMYSHGMHVRAPSYHFSLMQMFQYLKMSEQLSVDCTLWSFATSMLHFYDTSRVFLIPQTERHHDQSWIKHAASNPSFGRLDSHSTRPEVPAAPCAGSIKPCSTTPTVHFYICGTLDCNKQYTSVMWFTHHGHEPTTPADQQHALSPSTMLTARAGCLHLVQYKKNNEDWARGGELGIYAP